jgi:hypothetical protein
MPAQSWASVPPAPDWISMKQALPSIGLLNMRRNSSSPTRPSRAAVSASTACMVSSSSSVEASSKRSSQSARPWSISASVTTTPSRVFFLAELLGARGVVPDVGVFELLADFDQLFSLGIVVKDTSEVRALGP